MFRPNSQTSIVSSILTLLVPILCALGGSPAAAQGEANALVEVDCAQGQTLGEALSRKPLASALEIEFSGTCTEQLKIERDGVALRGSSEGAVLVGLIDVVGAARVTLERFSIQGDPTIPFSDLKGGVNCIEGCEAVIRNLLIENIAGRGVRVVASTATLEDVTVRNVAFGAYVFRAADGVLKGTIVGDRSVFGMDIVNSGVFSRQSDLSFSGNFFGLLVQVSAGLEHIAGTLKTNDNVIGILLAGQGTYAHASRVEANRNLLIGIFLDELSNMTPIVGAPTDGPAVTVQNNGQAGVLVERRSALELVEPSLVSDNGLGISVDNSVLRLTDAEIRNNSAGDLLLAFRSTATFNGDSLIGSPIQCDDTVAVRGTAECNTTALESSLSLELTVVPPEGVVETGALSSPRWQAVP